MTYDAKATAAYFDAFAEREWDRLETSLQGRVKYAVHRHFIEKHIRAGMRVLDVGCGPGRFAIDLLHLGASASLVDLSPVQLDLARKRIGELGALERIHGFHCLDMLDLTSLGETCCDAVVCFGGAVSYTADRHMDALRELAGVARPGSPILLSVMSLFGTLRLAGPLDAAAFLETLDDHLDWQAVLAGEGVVYTRPGSSEFHRPLALFTAEGLRSALVRTGLQVETIAASNPLVPEFLRIPKIEESARASAALASLEVALCHQPGLVDAGGHLLAVARKP